MTRPIMPVLALAVLVSVAALTHAAGGVAGFTHAARGAAALALAALPALVAGTAVLGRRPHAVERASWWRLMRVSYLLLTVSVMMRIVGPGGLQLAAHLLDLVATTLALIASLWWEFAHSNADHAGLLPDRALDTVLISTALIVAFWVLVVRSGGTVSAMSFFDWSNILQTSLGLICVAVTGVSLAATRQRSTVLAWGFLSISFATFGSGFDVAFGIGARTTLAAVATGACTGLLTAMFAVSMRRHGPPIVLDEGTARWRPVLTVAACITPALLYFWEALGHHRYGQGVPDARVISFALLLACVVCVMRVDRAVRRMDQLNASMDRIARSDHLTGMPNRRTADEELRRASSPGARLAVALCDLDHFKRVNDELGHTAGDNLLVAVSASWTRCLNDDEVLARYGGEEFLLISPNGTAERLGATIEDMRAVTPDGQGFSAGIAEWDGRENVRDLVQRADAALYAAKAGGRGRTCVAEAPTVEEAFDGR